VAAGLSRPVRPDGGRHRALAAALAALALAVALAGCGTSRSGPPYPPAGATPQTATTETAAARGAVVAALGPTGLAISNAATGAYQPREGPWLAAAPRIVLELDAPAAGPIGHVVLYGFGSSADATTAANDQASYVSSGPARVYFPLDARFTIRVVGSAVVFFTWSPGSDDERLAAVDGALASVGVGVTVPA
jgi:predicted small lipoprotein YifL